MENPEQEIAKALDGLRNAKAFPGLETRVLRALRDHAPRPAPSLWSALAPIWRSALSPASAVPACVVLLAGLLGYSLIVHAPGQSRARAHGSAPAASFAPRPAPVAVATARPSPVSRSTPSGKPAALETTRLRQHQAASRSGSQLRSFPAPPLPLTEQEKLLLRIAHTRKPNVIAPLKAETQIAQIARDKEEFNNFFNQHHGGTDE